MSDEELTVRLTAREARALAFSANLFQTLVEGLPESDEGALAVASGAMKLELALVQAQEAVS